MRNPFKKRNRQEPTKNFTGACLVRMYTGDGDLAGPCWHATYDGTCPTHGDVRPYLMGTTDIHPALPWPPEYQLPKFDGNPWAERLRARQENHKKGNGR